MAIKVEKLTKRFGNFTAVNAIDFAVPEGQIFGFLGPNGSGKTTTIRMLLGLLKPTSGKATVLGKDISQSSYEIRPQLGYMSQKFSLYSDLSVVENLKFFGRAYGLNNRKLQNRMDYVIDMAGLKGHENTQTSELSGGWAQRLALGAAIMHRPKLLFLDEPTAGVDPVSRRAFWDLLYQLGDEGTTIFVTTHYMDEAEHCENVAFIYYGNIIAHDTPQHLIEQVVPGQVVAFETPNPLDAMKIVEDDILTGKIDASMVSLFGAAVHIISEDVGGMKGYLQQRFPSDVESTHVLSPSLEDAFIKLVEAQ